MAAPNLRLFLDSVTPKVNLHMEDKNPERYFELSDLWTSLEEKNACGVHVPSRNIEKQCFAPLLSAIQLYTKKQFSATSSDVGSHNEMHNNELGYLYFEYFETTRSQDRKPLVNKVRDLATNFAGLESLRNTELSPASWIAIYWYDINRMNGDHQIADRNACFLTFHKLSPPLQDELDVLSLRPFGLVTTKAGLRNNPETGGHVHAAATLRDDAVNWVAEQGVQARYPDFISFSAGHEYL